MTDAPSIEPRDDARHGRAVRTGRRVPVSRRNRPAKPPLTRQGIVTLAVRILREEGLERATMRRLAAELDTGPASLYVYFHNAAELHGAVLDQLLSELDLHPAASGFDWRDRLVELLASYAELLVAHPSLARSVLALRPSGPNYLRLVDSVLTLLRAGGVPARQAAWGVDLLLAQATSIGAEQGTRGESTGTDEEEDALSVVVSEVSAQDFPSIAGVAGDLLSGTGEQRTRWGFAVLIQGIATTAAPGGPIAPG